MSQKQNTQASRTDELWKRFVGMFGGEAVARKFGDAPPAEWVAMIGQLNDYQLERGMRRLLHSGKATVPSLPEFLKLCRTVGGDEEFDGPQRPALSAPDPFQGDAWDMAANRHLLAYIARQLAEDPRRYGRGPSKAAMQVSKSKNADASPEFVANVGRLVAAKNAWAADMRDIAQNGEVAEDVQRVVWSDYIGRAEAEIARAHA